MSSARLSKRHLDKVVVIDFRDHVMGHHEPLSCRVFGRVKDYDSESVTIVSWECLDPDSETGFDHDNEETFTIIRSTISFIKVLR